MAINRGFFKKDLKSPPHKIQIFREMLIKKPFDQKLQIPISFTPRALKITINFGFEKNILKKLSVFGVLVNII